MRHLFWKLATWVLLIVTLGGCASTQPISSESSRFAEIYMTDTATALSLVDTALSGMKGYTIQDRGHNFLVVKYDPGGVFMGSATMKVSSNTVKGRDGDGNIKVGSELLFVDMTPWYSEDTSFTGANIISLLEKQVQKAANFKKIPFFTIQKE